MISYYIGLDLGQLSDYSALAVVEQPLWIPSDTPVSVGKNEEVGWVSPADLSWHDRHYVATSGQGRRPTLALKHLHRFERRTPYPSVAKYVADLLQRSPLADHSVLLVDATGVGRPVVDMLDQAGMNPIAITITGGSTVNGDMPEYRVPKRDLAMAVQVLLQNRRLAFAAGLPLLDILKRELQNFEVKIDPKTAHDSYLAWRDGEHDDLVLAVAMACWYREWSCDQQAQQFVSNYIR